MGFKECGESVYEYEYKEEYSKDIEIPEKPNRHGNFVERCPNCNSWRILFFEHRVNVNAQTPDGVFDFTVDHFRQDGENDYYHCYDCGEKWDMWSIFK
jgi:hypothetical protein